MNKTTFPWRVPGGEVRGGGQRDGALCESLLCSQRSLPNMPEIGSQTSVGALETPAGSIRAVEFESLNERAYHSCVIAPNGVRKIIEKFSRLARGFAGALERPGAPAARRGAIRLPGEAMRAGAHAQRRNRSSERLWRNAGPALGARARTARPIFWRIVQNIGLSIETVAASFGHSYCLG